MRFLRLVLVLFACALFASSWSQARAMVKAGDSVNVVCEEEPTLSKDYVITRDGYIIMQFIGALSIAGLREDTASAKIAATLIEQRILHKATVRLRVLGVAKGGLISFVGAIANPGEMYPRAGLRLSDVVKEARPTGAADMRKVRIIAVDGKAIIVDYTLFVGTQLAHNPEVRAGDRVFFDLVVRSPDVGVAGIVGRPGMVPFTNGLTVRGAIQMSGGLGAGADDSAITVQRAGASLPVNLKSADFTLMPSDHVFVPMATSRSFVTVTGLVKTPRRVPLQTGMTLGQAIDGAGGPADGADLQKVKLTRTVDGRKSQATHDYSLIKSGRTGDIALRTDDIVEVSAVKKAGGRRRNDLLKIGGIIVIGLLFGILK